MPGEYDQRFEKLEVLLQRTIGGVEETRMEMRDIRLELREHTSRFDKVDARLDKFAAGIEAKLAA